MTMEPPPPPPPPSGPPVGGQPVNIGDAVNYGWNAYWKNVGPMVVIALVIFGINIVFSAIGSASGSVALQVVLNLVGWLVGLFLALGWFRVAL